MLRKERAYMLPYGVLFMNRKLTFKYRLSYTEKLLQIAVAKKMGRSQGDAIRTLTKNAAREYGILLDDKNLESFNALQKTNIFHNLFN